MEEVSETHERVAGRILVLGHATSGKSTLILRLCRAGGALPPLKAPASTIGCLVEVCRLPDGRFLEFREIGGRSFGSRAHSVFITSVEYDGVMLVYDMSNVNSLKGIRGWLEDLKRCSLVVEINHGGLGRDVEDDEMSIPFVLVGTKADAVPLGAPSAWDHRGKAELPGFCGDHVQVSAINFSPSSLSSFLSAVQRHGARERSGAATPFSNFYTGKNAPRAEGIFHRHTS